MVTTELVAYHGDHELKAAVLAEMAEHRKADVLIQGVYWDNGRGCAVGCLTHDPGGGHAEYPTRWGIPEELAFLKDVMFDNLPDGEYQTWPERFLGAITPGAGLCGVYAAWCAELMVHPQPVVQLVGLLWQDAAADAAGWSAAARESTVWVAGRPAAAVTTYWTEMADQLIRCIQAVPQPARAET